MSSEMIKMRQQLEYLQAELSLRNGGTSCAELQVCSYSRIQENIRSIKVKSESVMMMQALKERIACLETTNEDLCRELHQYRSRYAGVEHSEKDFKDIQAVMIKLIHSLGGYSLFL